METDASQEEAKIVDLPDREDRPRASTADSGTNTQILSAQHTTQSQALTQELYADNPEISIPFIEQEIASDKGTDQEDVISSEIEPEVLGNDQQEVVPAADTPAAIAEDYLIDIDEGAQEPYLKQQVVEQHPEFLHSGQEIDTLPQFTAANLFEVIQQERADVINANTPENTLETNEQITDISSCTPDNTSEIDEQATAISDDAEPATASDPCAPPTQDPVPVFTQDAMPLDAQDAVPATTQNAQTPALQQANDTAAPSSHAPRQMRNTVASGGTRTHQQSPSLPGGQQTPGAPVEVTPSHTLLAGENPGFQTTTAPTQLFAQGLRAINVEVDMGPSQGHRMLRMVIDLNQMEGKRYLGGFRNRHTGAIYHHAFTQTPKQPKYTIEDRKFSRETQTVYAKTRGQQTWREQGTQMERPGLMLDNSHDVEVSPGPYTTSDEVLANRRRATITIQRYTRGWFARRNARYLQIKKQEREAFLRELEVQRMLEAENLRNIEIHRRIHPKTAADFQILYNELEAWRLQEARRIKESSATPEQCQAALQQLLHRETKLLQTIDRLKLTANAEHKKEKIQRILQDMSRPKTWYISNGKKVAVHTPFTTRAQELSHLYNGLLMTDLTLEQRLDILLHVKWTVKEFDCNLTRELVDLIEREADLLNRGRNPSSLEGLRKRISSLFLAFVETTEFNPEAIRLDISANDTKETYEFANLDPAHTRAFLPKASVMPSRG